MSKVREVIVIGLDGAMLYFIKKLVSEGELPTFERLISNGVIAEASPCPPCDTPTNWTTIATGATTAMHGVTSFYLHFPGEPLGLGLKLRYRGQLAKYCKAEYLWEVADKHGIKTLVVNYPAGWGSKLKMGIMIAGSWPMPSVPPKVLIKHRVYSTYPERGEGLIEFIGSIDAFKGLKSFSPIVKVRVKVDKEEVLTSSILLDFYILDTKGRGYDVVVLVQNNKKYFLKPLKWSEWIPLSLDTKYGKIKAIFKLRVLELSRDAKLVKVEFSDIFNVDKWTYPNELGEELVKSAILPEGFFEDVGKDYVIYGKEHPYLMGMVKEAKGLAKVISYLKQTRGWRICFFHFHIFDAINHRYLKFSYKHSPFYDETKAKESDESVKLAYKIADKLLNDLLEKCTTDGTLVIVVSDHGAVPSWNVVSIRKALVDANLLVYKWDSSMNKYRVDWSRTKAFPYYEPTYVWVNLRGRDPDGIVSLSEYEEVREEIIEALYGIKDEETGTCPVELAVRREKDPYVGNRENIADTIGDVIYYLKPGYQLYDGILESLDSEFVLPNEFQRGYVWRAERVFGAHVYYQPITRVNEFTINGIFLAKGPGIVRGEELKKPIRLIDIVPTVSYLLDIPNPRHCEGKILEEILE